MRKSIVLSVLICISIPLVSHAQYAPSRSEISKNFNAFNSVEQRDFKERLTLPPSAGDSLLTPPIGSLDSKVEQTQEYIKRIVENLAGDRLRAAGVHLLINIYGSNSVNAYMTNFNSQDKRAKEAGKIWLTRRLMGWASDEKPIYELVLFTPLLQEMKSESELAFVIGHELTHLFEKHTESEAHGGRTQAWWSSQRFEAIADHGAVEMMVGKYALDGALSALDRLALLRDERDLSIEGQSIESAVSDHHHEGVRISFIQAYVDHLQKTHAQALAPTDQLLPNYVKINKAGRTLKLKSSTNAFGLVRNLIRDSILKGQPSWFDANGNSRSGKIQNLLSDTHFLAAADVPELLIESIASLNQSSVSPYERVRIFLSLNTLLERGFAKSEHVSFNMVQQHQVSAFMLKNSIGPNGFSWGRYLSDANRIKGPESEDPSTIITSLTYLHPVFAVLSKTESNWKFFARDYIQALLNQSDVEEALGNFVLQFKGLFDSSKKTASDEIPLRDAMREAIYQFIFTPEFYQLTDSVFSKIGANSVYLISMIRHIEDAFKKDPIVQYQDVWSRLSSLPARYIRARDQFLKDQANGTLTHEQAGIFVNNLATHEYYPFSSSERRDLLPAIMKVATYFNDNAYKNQMHEEFPAHIDFKDSVRNLFIQLLNEPATAPEQKQVLVKTLASAINPESDFVRTSLSPETRESLRGYFNHMSGSDFVGIFKKDISSGIDALQAILDDPSTQKNMRRRQEIEKDLKNHPNDEVKRSLEREKIKLMRDGFQQKNIIDLYAKIYFQSHLSVLTLAAQDSETATKLATRIDLTGFKNLISEIYKIRTLASDFRDWPEKNLKSNTFSVSPKTAMFLMKILVGHQKELAFQEWYQTYERIYRLNSQVLDGDPDLLQHAGDFVFDALSKMKPGEAYQWLRKPPLFRSLSNEKISTLLIRYFQSQWLPRNNLQTQAVAISKIEKELKIKEKFPDLENLFVTRLAEAIHVQPHEINILFPKDERSFTDQSKEFSSEIRGASLIASFAEKQTVEENIHIIEYLMGRENELPTSISNAIRSLESKSPIGVIIRNTRDRLKYASVSARVVVVNSLLASPRSPIAKDQGLKTFLDFLLRNVSQENQTASRELAHALIQSFGRLKSLPIAYVMAQKSDQGALSEGEILKSLFEAYGAPGIKLAQYLAFTGEFKQYESILNSTQDAAMPITYFEALELLQKRFQEGWPPEFRITQILGTGSVNIAIEYVNSRSGAPVSEVISISRGEIELTTKENFRRLGLAVDELLKTPETAKRLGYLKGLLRIIQSSVEVEFDKLNAARIQTRAGEVYARKIGRWQLGSVQVHEEKNKALLMEKAPGKTARKILLESPALYLETMSLVHDVELDILLGVTSKGSRIPKFLWANPDMHNGQVLIDEKSGRITILDFGQAVEINAAQRDVGIELLRIVSQSETAGESYARLMSLLKKQKVRLKNPLSQNEFGQIFSRASRMDVFTVLISELADRGYKVPLSSVHWVLGINRWLTLGHKLNRPVEIILKERIAAKKLHVSVETYRKLQELLEAVKTVKARAGAMISQGFNCMRIFSLKF